MEGNKLKAVWIRRRNTFKIKSLKVSFECSLVAQMGNILSWQLHNFYFNKSSTWALYILRKQLSWCLYIFCCVNCKTTWTVSVVGGRVCHYEGQTLEGQTNGSASLVWIWADWTLAWGALSPLHTYCHEVIRPTIFNCLDKSFNYLLYDLPLFHPRFCDCLWFHSSVERGKHPLLLLQCMKRHLPRKQWAAFHIFAHRKVLSVLSLLAHWRS